jgi:hypothetical protein
LRLILYLINQLTSAIGVLLKYFSGACMRFIGRESTCMGQIARELETTSQIMSGGKPDEQPEQMFMQKLFSYFVFRPLQAIEWACWVLLYLPIWGIGSLLGFFLEKSGQSVSLKYVKSQIGPRLTNLYDSFEDWWKGVRANASAAKAPGRDAGEWLLDNVFRLDKFDQEQAEALDYAYERSAGLHVTGDWLSAWNTVRQRRLEDLEHWRNISKAIEWGELGFDYVKFVLTKIVSVANTIMQTLIQGTARILLQAAEKYMEKRMLEAASLNQGLGTQEAERAEKWGKAASNIDLLSDIVEIIFERSVALGLRIQEMWTSVYDAPDCIRALYR